MSDLTEKCEVCEYYDPGYAYCQKDNLVGLPFCADFEANPQLQKIAKLERDCLVFALRLLGEDASTFSPECAEVMQRWAPKVEALLADPEGKI